MKIGIAVLILTLALSLAYLQPKKVDSSVHSAAETSSAPNQQTPPPAGNGSPLQWFPIKEQYVTTEGDPFLVLVRFNCADSPNPPRFELLPPSPPFAQVILTCPPGPAPFAHAIIAISPSAGDAGKYQVKLGATGCGAPPEEKPGEILSLNVKVKRAR